MAPKKTALKRKETKRPLVARKSQRLSDRSIAAHAVQITKSAVRSPLLPQLNDDCLLEIFSFLSIKHLLYDVAICCRRFKALTEVAIQKKCRNEQFVFNYMDAKDNAIIGRFAEMMHDVSIFRGHRKNGIKDSFTWLKQCRALKSLRIQNLQLIYDSECFGTFGKLETLTLDRCHGSSAQYEHLITACKSLKSITLLNWIYVPEDILAHISTLQSLERVTSQHDVSKSSTTAANLAKIAQLKKLKFICFNIGFCDQYASYITALYASDSLEEMVLNVNFIDDNVAVALDHFPKLKSCELNLEQWVPQELVRPTRERVKANVLKLQDKIKKFDVTHNMSAVAENRLFSHIILCVQFTRL